VSQLCIWSFSGYVLSIFSDPGNATFDTGSPNYYNSRSATSKWVLEELGQIELKDTERKIAIIGLLLARQINCFGEPQFVMHYFCPSKGLQVHGQYQSPLDIFEIGVVRVLSDVSDYMLSANTTKVDMDREASFIHDISDIRSELAMIDEILIQQQQVLWGVMENSPTFPSMEKARSQLKRYRERVTKIDKDAERIEKTIQDQLTLKRTHASMQDARASIVLGTAVIGFTIITIIFAPIAFTASLFALPISNLIKHQEKVGDTSVYPSSYVAGWFGEYHPVMNVSINWHIEVLAEITTIIVTGLSIWASLWLFGRREKKAEKQGNVNKTGRTEETTSEEYPAEENEEKKETKKNILFSNMGRLHWPRKRSTARRQDEEGGWWNKGRNETANLYTALLFLFNRIFGLFTLVSFDLNVI
jgi:hypothetical protein